MTRKQTVNTFSEGLVMDLNPISTPNNVLTNALNATYITYNGNEYVLLNDMGNGRVETAYLPQGYIPLGTTSFGGIIYIVSYNPLIDKSQIGCFPSPERNIDSYENTVSTETIQDSDFFIMNANTPTEVSNNVRIIQLSNIKLSPGDKYIVHGTNIIANLNILSGYKIGTETLNTKVLNIRLATQDTNGNLIYLDTDLEKYEFKITLPDNSVRTDSYIIKLEESETLFDTDIDAVRSYLASKYNIFNNNVSGNIYIVAKLETIDTFDVTYTVKSTITQNSKLVYYPEFNTEVTSSNGTSIFKWVWTDGTNSYDSSSLNNNKVYYDKDSGIKTFVCTPYMKFNNDIVALPYLSKTINIDFQLVGNNTSDLFLWRYYNSDTYLTLNWGLLNHYEPELVDYIEFVFTDLLNTSTFTKTIKDYVSYSGTFIRDFAYDSQLIPNTLYHVTIKLYVKNSSIYSIDKLLYTSKVFNNKYLTDSSVKDFGTLKIQDELDLNLNTDVTYLNEITTNLVKPTTTTKTTEWLKGNPINTETLGYTWYKFNNELKFNSSLKYSYQFTDNYNIFTLNRYIANGDISYTFNIPNSLPTISTPTTLIIGDLTSSELNGYIEKDSIFINMDLLTTNVTDILKNKIIELKFDLEGSYGNPIWASMVQGGVTYTNLIAPLIYNDATLNAYGFTATVNTETPLLCKIDTKKILCIGPNSYSNKDWWIAYAEFIENNKILLKDRKGDLDQTDLKLGSSQYYDSIISDFANKYFNNSPIIPYCFVLTYNYTSYTLYNNDGSNPVEVGTVAGITYADGKNTVADLTKVLYYGVLIKNSAGYYIPIKLISVGNSDDTYTITDEPNSYVLYDIEVGATNNITKSSINRKMYELLCQLYKVYTKVNYTQTGTYTYDKKSYYEPFNLEITKDITILLNYINKTIRPFITDLSGINFDINNLNFDIDNVVKNVTLKFTIPILLKLLNYYLLDFSYANFIIRTNTKEFYIPEGITFTTGSLYFINKDAQGDYERDLVLLNKNSSQTFLNNFRKLLSIKYTNKEHECVFSSIADATNLNKMNILQVLTLNNGVINMETNDSTHELTATGMAFYQSNYGNLIGNLDTN